MKATVTIVRIFVGALFIISGLVKANDPLGLSYKMQEFFEVWNASLSAGSFLFRTIHFFNEHSLTLSVIMIGLEIMAGIALLIGWKRKVHSKLVTGTHFIFYFLNGVCLLVG